MSWGSYWIQYICETVWHRVKSGIKSSISVRPWHKFWCPMWGFKKNKQVKICEKYMIFITPRYEARWQNQNQQWSHEVRILTPSRGIQRAIRTSVEWWKHVWWSMNHENQPQEVLRTQQHITSAVRAEDTATHHISCESRGYCVSNWPLLSCLWI